MGPAECGAGEWSRIIAANVPVGFDVLVHRLDGDPRLHINNAIGWSDMYLVEPTQIEHHSWHKRCCTTHQSIAACYGNHRDTMHRREADHGRHLRGMLRTDHA